MIISLIAAMTKERVIGVNNHLPWHLPTDLKHFKQVTMGKPIIMGRKTYDSTGNPLPGRRNIIVTRQTHLDIPGCDIVNSLEEAIELLDENTEIMVIGGGEIFKQALPLAKRLYLTVIDQAIEGDAYFPEYNINDWHVINNIPGAENNLSFHFMELERNR